MRIAVIIAYFVGFLMGYFTNRKERCKLRDKNDKLKEFQEYIDTKGGAG